MPLPGLSSHVPFRPMLDALRWPWSHWPHSASRTTADGKLYVGDGQPVMVYPVFGGGAASTARLRAVLDKVGFTSYDWGQGIDRGPVGMRLSRWLRQLEERVIDVFEVERRPLTLVGWGLSGIYARELAKRTTPLVRQVITLSTPFNLSCLLY